jgi:predicted nucleotidyltransferase
VPDAIDLLFTDYQRRILAPLLLRPDESQHVRELARMTGVPPGSLHRELRTLAEAGLLLREPLGNQVRYRANRNSAIHPELAAIFRKTIGLATPLAEALKTIGQRVHVAFVFGSMAASGGSASSDIDLMVVGDATFSEVVRALASMKEALGRDVNPVAMTLADFQQKLQAGDRFVARVMAEPKLWVIGAEHDLGESPPDRTAQAS